MIYSAMRLVEDSVPEGSWRNNARDPSFWSLRRSLDIVALATLCEAIVFHDRLITDSQTARWSCSNLTNELTFCDILGDKVAKARAIAEAEELWRVFGEQIYTEEAKRWNDKQDKLRANATRAAVEAIKMESLRQAQKPPPLNELSRRLRAIRPELPIVPAFLPHRPFPVLNTELLRDPDEAPLIYLLDDYGGIRDYEPFLSQEFSQDMDHHRIKTIGFTLGAAAYVNHARQTGIPYMPHPLRSSIVCLLAGQGPQDVAEQFVKTLDFYASKAAGEVYVQNGITIALSKLPFVFGIIIEKASTPADIIPIALEMRDTKGAQRLRVWGQELQDALREERISSVYKLFLHLNSFRDSLDIQRQGGSILDSVSFSVPLLKLDPGAGLFGKWHAEQQASQAPLAYLRTLGERMRGAKAISMDIHRLFGSLVGQAVDSWPPKLNTRGG